MFARNLLALALGAVVLVSGCHSTSRRASYTQPAVVQSAPVLTPAPCPAPVVGAPGCNANVPPPPPPPGPPPFGR